MSQAISGTKSLGLFVSLLLVGFGLFFMGFGLKISLIH